MLLWIDGMIIRYADALLTGHPVIILGAKNAGHLQQIHEDARKMGVSRMAYRMPPPATEGPHMINSSVSGRSSDR